MNGVGVSAMNAASSPHLNLAHGFFKKIEQTQMARQQMVKEDAMRKSETAKLARKVGQNSRMTRPTMPIYRPPPNKQFSSGRQAAESGQQQLGVPQYHHQQKGVHFQGDPEVSHELKSALKRSKSFGGKEEVFEKDGLPVEYTGIVKKAMTDPNSMSPRQLMEVVRVLCNKAVENISSAQPTADMCFTIIEKERGETFLESLLNSCREWFNERDKLLRSSLLSSAASGGGSGSKRWTAYVTFLMELYLRLKKYQRQNDHRELEPGGKFSPTSVGETQRLTLAFIIYECLHIIIKPPSVTNTVEIECFRSTLTTSGNDLESDLPEKMERLVSSMRDAFLDTSTLAPIRKTLLELIELRASAWEFNLTQASYYFPYTRQMGLGSKF